MIRPRLLPSALAAGALALLVAACSGSAAPSGATIASGQPLPSAALPSLAVPSVALPSVALPSGSFAIPSVSLPSEDKDLENRLPAQVNGVTLTKASFKGAEFFSQGGSSAQAVQDFLTALGKSPADFSAAFATDATGQLKVQLGAFRIAGADPGALLNGFVAATKQESPGDVIQQANVGGKNVTQITDPTDTTNGSTYVYANGDTLFFAESTDPALAGAALQAMP